MLHLGIDIGTSTVKLALINASTVLCGETHTKTIFHRLSLMVLTILLHNVHSLFLHLMNRWNYLWGLRVLMHSVCTLRLICRIYAANIKVL